MTTHFTRYQSRIHPNYYALMLDPNIKLPMQQMFKPAREVGC